MSKKKTFLDTLHDMNCPDTLHPGAARAQHGHSTGARGDSMPGGDCGGSVCGEVGGGRWEVGGGDMVTATRHVS